MNINFLKKLSIGGVSALVILSLSFFSFASVTMNGTRIIYNAKSRSVDVNLKNKATFPYVVQAWFDDGDMSINPNQKTNIPFVATPPIFRVQGNSLQIVRIAYTGSQKLPQDRESVFYFNFLQIPPTNVAGADESNKNKMLVTLRNRVKMFYRPDGLKGNPNKLLETLEIKRINNGKSLGIEVINNQPYHASLSQIIFTKNNKKHQINADMIAPFSSEKFFFDGVSAKEMGEITITLINDQGARISASYSLDI